jgi:hypothetical protein
MLKIAGINNIVTKNVLRRYFTSVKISSSNSGCRCCPAGGPKQRLNTSQSSARHRECPHGTPVLVP